MPLLCRLLTGAFRPWLVLFKCCCVGVGVYHWYVLKGGAFLRAHVFAPFTVSNAPHLHIHHVEVLCFRLYPLFF